MRTSRPLAVLGALAAASASWGAPVDTSEWKCASCPFEKGAAGTVDAGIGHVSGQSTRFSDYTGLDQGIYVIGAGDVRYRSTGGFFASLGAIDLGLDSRALAAEVGMEGLYTLRLAYDELPRHFANGARTPFLGNGGNVLTLPVGFPASPTTAMPLATTLQAIDLGYKRSRLGAGFAWTADANWTYRVDFRHHVRDGTMPTAGSFLTTASQLAAPVDQVTDQIEVAASYASRRWQATLSYYGSLFRNGQESLTWANPFAPIVAGADRGQLALAPDNEFHQVAASGGAEIMPWLRASGDIALGRMTQDAAYVAATLNPGLAATVPALASTSLRGRANTFNANVKLTASPMPGLRVNAVYARDVRENETPRESYPRLTTDMFLNPGSRINVPYSFWQDRFKLFADYRGPASLKTSAGIEHDVRQRSYQEVVRTRETTVWGAVAGQARDDLAWSLKLAHSQRDNSDYGIATSIDPAQNPLLRKFNLADRSRAAAKLRGDWTASEKLTVGVALDLADDDYRHSAIGLTSSRSHGLSGDLSYALSEQTQLRAFAQGERIRSRQAGSQAFANPDWTGRVDDDFWVVGLGAKHLALGGKLDLGADLSFSRSRSNILVDNGASPPQFPTATTALDSLKLSATYRLKDNLSLVGGYWYERYHARDWRLDGILPDTVPDLLAFGEQAPSYTIHVVRVALRYRF